MLKEPTRRIRFSPGRSAALASVAEPGGHGVLARDGFAGGQRHRSNVVASRLKRKLGSSRSGEGEAAIAYRSTHAAALITQQIGKHATRVQLPREADHPGEHQGLVRGPERAGTRFSLARSAAHLGEWRQQNGTPLFALVVMGVGVDGDGATLCVPRRHWRRMPNVSRIRTDAANDGTNPSHPETRACACKPLIVWLRGQDLNLRPSGYEPDERQTAPPRERIAIIAQSTHAGQRALQHRRPITPRPRPKLQTSSRGNNPKHPHDWQPRDERPYQRVDETQEDRDETRDRVGRFSAPSRGPLRFA